MVDLLSVLCAVIVGWIAIDAVDMLPVYAGAATTRSLPCVLDDDCGPVTRQ